MGCTDFAGFLSEFEELNGFMGAIFRPSAATSSTTVADATLKIPPSEKEKNGLVLPDATVEWFEPLESAKRLRKIFGLLQKDGIAWYSTDRTAMKYKAEEKSAEVLVEYLLQILFSAHILLVEEINKKPLSVKVPWDKATGFPSPPTLAADAGVFAQISNSSVTASYRPRDWALARSFGDWQHFCSEKMKCACGSGMRLKEIPIKVLTTTAVGKSGNRFCLKNLVGVMAEVQSHLKNHYSFSESIKENPFIRIICRMEAELWRSQEDDKKILGELRQFRFAQEFNHKLFFEEAKRAAEKFVGAATKV